MRRSPGTRWRRYSGNAAALSCPGEHPLAKIGVLVMHLELLEDLEGVLDKCLNT